MAKSATILCITEGKKPESAIIEKTIELFLDEARHKQAAHIEYISENIYSLFEEIQNHITDIGDEDIDTFSIIKERYKRKNESFLAIDRDQITAIYLFFDYDGHDHRAQCSEDYGVAKIRKMLEIFNDAQEKGSLFISYPMAEAYRDNITDHVKTLPISDFKNYKARTGSNSQSVVDPRTWQDKTCAELFAKHLSTANYLANGSFNIPKINTEVEHFSQIRMLDAQQQKFITPHKTVAILSYLPLFVFEHRGKKFLEEWYSQKS